MLILVAFISVALYSLWYWFQCGISVFCQDTPLNKRIRRTMEGLRFYPSFWLINRHVQSVFTEILGKRPPSSVASFVRREFTMKDGGLVAIDFLDYSSMLDGPLVLILPGLMGHTRSKYVQHLAVALRESGYRPAVFVNRGLNRLPLKTNRAYSATWTADLAYCLDEIASSRVYLIGFSLGSMILSKYLSENPHEKIVGALAVSSTVHAHLSTAALCRFPAQQLYNGPLTASLNHYLKKHVQILETNTTPGVDINRALKSKKVIDFDRFVTAPSFGFESVEAYYDAASPVNNLPRIRVPLVFLQAADDPFSPRESLPVRLVEEDNEKIVLCVTSSGGHMGFLEGMWPTGRNYHGRWCVAMLNEFEKDFSSPPKMSRSDGRMAKQLRPMSSEQRLLNRADGSARFQHGRTSVIVAVYGPYEATFGQTVVDRTQIEVVFKPITGIPGSNEHFYEGVLRQALNAIVLGSLYPRTVLRVVVQVLHDDGGLIDAAINGCCLALMDAGVDLRKLLVACSCIIDKEGELVVDAMKDEENDAVCILHAGFEGQSGEDVVFSNTDGVFESREQLMECIALCRRGARSVSSFLKLSLEKKCAIERDIDVV